MNNTIEYILCAAVKRKTPRECTLNYHPEQNDLHLIEIGYRHHDIMIRFRGELDDCNQGFYTSYGRYLNRTESMMIAYLANQVSPKVAFKSSKNVRVNDPSSKNVRVNDPSTYNELYSEDLY